MSSITKTNIKSRSKPLTTTYKGTIINSIETTEQRRAQPSKERPEPGNSEASSSSNGQRRKRLRQGLKPRFKPCGLPEEKNSVV